MRIDIYSRIGKFDFAHPEDESISCSIRVFGDDGEMLKGCSITPEYEISTDDFDFKTIAEDAAKMIQDYQKKLWISSAREKDLAFADFLIENREAIAKGTREYKIKVLTKRRDEIDRQLTSLE